MKILNKIDFSSTKNLILLKHLREDKFSLFLGIITGIIFSIANIFIHFFDFYDTYRTLNINNLVLCVPMLIISIVRWLLIKVNLCIMGKYDQITIKIFSFFAKIVQEGCVGFVGYCLVDIIYNFHFQYIFILYNLLLVADTFAQVIQQMKNDEIFYIRIVVNGK